MTKFGICYVAVLGLSMSSVALCQSEGIVAEFVVTQSRPIGLDNRIERTTIGDYSRDSYGRSRLEVGGMLLIADPVESLAWNVNIASGIALQYRSASDLNPDDSSLMAGIQSDELQIQQPNWPTLTEQDVRSFDLGVETINDIKCSGRKWVYSLPAGTIGNVSAIDIATEVWISDEFGFKLPVMITVQSPMSGTKTRQLRRIRSTSFDNAHFRPDASHEIRVVEEGSALFSQGPPNTPTDKQR